jgi:hypothetical protein
MRCLKAELLESPLVSLEESLVILKTTAELCCYWSLSFTEEDNLLL